MPIYAYKCAECSHGFELLVQGSTVPECPNCNTRNLEKQLTGFAVGATGGAADFGGSPGACGSCGDPRGPGSCSLN